MVQRDHELQQALAQMGYPLDYLTSELCQEDGNIVLRMAEEFRTLKRSPTLQALFAVAWEEEPVDAYTFLNDPYFMRYGKSLFPLNMYELIETLSGRSIGEVILGGSQRWGKTYEAAFGIAYDLYRLLCLRNPQAHYGLGDGTTMALVNVSITAENAEGVLGGYILKNLTTSPWFEDHFYKGDKMRRKHRPGLFPEKNLIYKAGNSSEFSVISWNIVGGGMDEANFMIGAKRTRRSIMADEHDQARVVWNSMARRGAMTSVGRIPAKFWLISSAQFPGDFVEQRIKETESDPSVKVIKHNSWETKMSLPEGKCPFSRKYFPLFIGDAVNRSRIVEDPALPAELDESFDLTTAGFTAPPGCQYIKVPVEFKQRFVQDLFGSIRDTVGCSILAKNPFITDTESLQRYICRADCGDIPRVHPYEHIETDIISAELIKPELLPVTVIDGRVRPALHPNEPRVVHVDLAKNLDSAGLSIAHFGGYKDLILELAEVVLDRRGMPVIVDGAPQVRKLRFVESRPITIVDFQMRFLPPRHGVINPRQIRAVVLALSRIMGFEIELWTYDQYQSQESIAELTDGPDGITAELFSVDTKPDAYMDWRCALSDDRFSSYDYPPMVQDASSLEWDPRKGKVDHREANTDGTKGTKDVSDCDAAVTSHIHRLHATFKTPVSPTRDIETHISPQEQMRIDFDRSLGKVNRDYKFDPLAGLI